MQEYGIVHRPEFADSSLHGSGSDYSVVVETRIVHEFGQFDSGFDLSKEVDLRTDFAWLD